MSIFYVGIDISQATFTSSLWFKEKPLDLGEFSNDLAGFEALAVVLAPYRASDQATIHIILEATGGYELRLLAFINQQGWLFSLPNPQRVREWARGMGYRSKTDRVDGRMLAHFGQQCHPPAQSPVPEAVQQLDSLLQRQEDVRKLLREESNRRHALSHRPQAAQAAHDSLTRTLTFLEEELQHITVDIDQVLAANPELRPQAAQLLTVAGVGAKTVLPLLVLCHHFQARTHGQGTSKGIVAYTGLDSKPFSSGTSVHKQPSISKMGNAQIRTRLYLAALGGMRGQNSPLRDFYLRLVGRGKPRKLALVAASRKIVVWAWAVFQQGVDFDRSRFATLAK
jgi:transposase